MLVGHGEPQPVEPILIRPGIENLPNDCVYSVDRIPDNHTVVKLLVHAGGVVLS